jgi:hypothetical protein
VVCGLLVDTATASGNGQCTVVGVVGVFSGQCRAWMDDEILRYLMPLPSLVGQACTALGAFPVEMGLSGDPEPTGSQCLLSVSMAGRAFPVIQSTRHRATPPHCAPSL